MKKQGNIKSFTQATSATLKLFAEDNKLDVHFSAKPVERVNASVIDFPALDAKHPDYFYIRYLTDKHALQKRWEKEAINKAQKPKSAGGQAVFRYFNHTRLMAKAHEKHWKGIYNNFIYQYVKDADTLGLLDNNHINMLGRSQGVSLALLDYMGYDLPDSLKGQAQAWLELIQDELPSQKALKAALNNQETWLSYLQNILNSVCPEEEDLRENPHKENAENSIQNRGKQQSNSEKNPADVEGSPGNEAEGEEDKQSQANPQKSPHGAEDFDAEVAQNRNSEGHKIEAKLAYRIFSQKNDLIAPATQLASMSELQKLRLQLDEKTQNVQNIINRLANKLQRHLMAQQKRFWQFDLEDGILDASRLARIVANPTLSLAYKQEVENPLRHTCVSLLIDNSGSMRGRPIALAAVVTEILARTLERCGISVEILGFTTRHWRGGESKKDWENAGMPKAPGRLNDLLHIIYKSAEQPYRRARFSLALMLKDGILKENIDGEALLWAASRLMQRSEQRKILIVLSDGAPVDDATLGANEPDILYRHLIQVIKQIENQKQIELMAFGIGHDVTDIYSNAVTLSTINELADTLFNEMIEKLKQKSYLRS